VISRLRKNAVGWDDSTEYSGRGRPRKSGKQWKLAELLKAFKPELNTVHIYGKDRQVAAVTRDVWLRTASGIINLRPLSQSIGLSSPAALLFAFGN
jgi:hypothetical protein